MICTQCDHDMLDCNCPDALERLRWIVSPGSPVALNFDQALQYEKRILELEGERELRNIGSDNRESQGT